MIPKGKLIIIGGHEDKGALPGQNLTVHKNKNQKSRFEILGALITKIPRQHHVIEVIASASSIPEEMDEMYINAYKQEGFTHVGFIKVDNAADASNEEYLTKIRYAHAVFFTGGDQVKLIAALSETPLMAAITKKYYSDEHFIVGGTSAGAMCMPEVIITGGIIGAALYKDDIHIAKGLGLVKDVLVDTHFIKRGRFARLAHAVTLNPSCLGIGLEEDTALLISEGNKAKCIGSGMVVLIDGSNITDTNISTADHSTPIVVAGLVVSIMAEGSRYLLKERVFEAIHKI